MEPIAYTISDASALLSVNRRTMLKWISEGKLKAARLDKDYRVSRAELARFWEEAGGGVLFPQDEQEECVMVRVESSDYLANLDPDGTMTLEDGRLFYCKPTQEIIVNKVAYVLVIPVG